MTLKKINIDELRLGMFVSELDISWVKSPFFRHTRHILRQEDIELLKKAGVASLTIDLSKSTEVEKDEESSRASDVPDNSNQKKQHTKKTAQLSGARAAAKTKKSSVSANSREKKSKANNSEETKNVSARIREPKIPLQQEFKVARRIQSEVLNAVVELQQAFEQGQIVAPETVNPVVEKTLESIDNNSQAIMALLHEGRDGGKIAMHSFGVFALVLLLSSHLNFSLEEQYLLGLAALSHDAGWTKLPSQLMSKGKPYTFQERILAQQHIPIVLKMLSKQADLPDAVYTMVAQHHELLDGTGFPDGLSGDQLHPWGRLLATCNEYDELVHGLGEKPGMTPQNALSVLFQMANRGLLDKFYTTRLISLLGVYPLGSAVELQDGKLGVVVELHPQTPMQPTVKVFYDAPGIISTRPTNFDLSKIDGKIKRVLDIFGADKDFDPRKLLVFSGSMLE